MIEIDDVIKQVTKKTEYDQEVVEAVCKHVFKYTVDVMKDETDYHEILFNGLLKFKLKNRFKEDKTKQYSPKL